jgi:putative toxin-antitoxin system antitoxin component (TIGR02293 family)
MKMEPVKYPEIDEEYAIVAESAEVYVTRFFDIAQMSGYKKEELAEVMDSSLKTFTRYKDQNKKLSQTEGEKVLKMQILFQWGKDVFGNMDSFRQWMDKPAYGLGGRVPFDLMKTITGIDLIINELKNIAYGNLS